eukprot:6458565-Amphidinium_carterae.3
MAGCPHGVVAAGKQLVPKTVSWPSNLSLRYGYIFEGKGKKQQVVGNEVKVRGYVCGALGPQNRRGGFDLAC